MLLHCKCLGAHTRACMSLMLCLYFVLLPQCAAWHHLSALQELLFPEHHPYQHVIRNVVIQMGRAERAVLCSDMLEGRKILT